MNQIPNIEEWKKLAKEILAPNVTYIDPKFKEVASWAEELLNAFWVEQQKDLDAFIDTIHHQLQKAREEEKSSILKLALTMGDCPINNPEADAGWMKFQHDFCLKLTKDNKKSILSENDQSELDQPTV